MSTHYLSAMLWPGLQPMHLQWFNYDGWGLMPTIFPPNSRLHSPLLLKVNPPNLSIWCVTRIGKVRFRDMAMKGKLKLSELFMLHFNELRNATNDNPQTLINFFREKPNLKELTQKVRESAEVIERIGDRRKYLVQVPTQFISDWKTYKYEWKKQAEYLYYVDVCEMLSGMGLDDDISSKPETFEEYKKRPPMDSRCAPQPDFEEDFDPSTHDGKAAISDMTQLAAHELENNRPYDDDQMNYRMANTWNIGIQAMEFVNETIGIELGAVFDRWNKVPSIFVPRHVSDSHGLTEKGSLYDLLNDAIRAYVAGAPAASVAMCRAILEVVIKKHYVPNERGNLKNLINLAVARYDFLEGSKKKLHNLRKDANEILHKYGTTGTFRPEDEDALISFFKDIKFYIERAPER